MVCGHPVSSELLNHHHHAGLPSQSRCHTWLALLPTPDRGLPSRSRFGCWLLIVGCQRRSGYLWGETKLKPATMEPERATSRSGSVLACLPLPCHYLHLHVGPLSCMCRTVRRLRGVLLCKASELFQIGHVSDLVLIGVSFVLNSLGPRLRRMTWHPVSRFPMFIDLGGKIQSQKSFRSEDSKSALCGCLSRVL